ncbi:extracellular solute-binding protein, partial [Gemmiger formicilis]
MKKALSAAMAAGMTAVMLAGCGSSASSAAESTAPAESTSAAASTEAAAESVVSAPTALSFVFADGDDTFKTQMNKIVDDFNAANPDITITIEPGDGGSYSEFLKTKDSVGEFPDMMEMRDTAMYVRAGKVAPLSDDVKALFTSTVDFDGVTYTAPFSGANTMGIMYNKKYFA